LWKIAWRSIQRRGLASVLTAFSMALGVMLVVAVLLIHGVVSESFQKNSSLGYNVILGVKGGKLQLVLNSVFYLSQPIENVPWEFYEDFLTAEQRGDGVDGKFAPYVKRVVPICMGDYFREFRVIGTTPEFFDVTDGDDQNPQLLYPFAEGQAFKTNGEEYGFFEAVIGSRVAAEQKLKVGDEIVPTHGSEEGPEHDRFYIVGVLAPSGTPNDRAVFVNMEGFYLLDGHALPFGETDEPNVTESQLVAFNQFASEKLKNGQSSVTWEALLENWQLESTAEDPRPAAEPVIPATPATGDSTQPAYLRKNIPLPKNQREVTALLLRTIDPVVTMGLTNTINEKTDRYQAVLPIQEITVLLNMIVSPIQKALLAITALICLVSGVGILVSIYNSMSDRTREIGIMRSLGAGRRTVMAIVLLEAVILAVGGGFLGWMAGHVAIAVAAPEIEQQTGVQVGLFDITPPIPELRYSDGALQIERSLGDFGGLLLDKVLSPEVLLIPTIIILAVIVGFLPAVTAYKTDVAKSLSANP
jgi:putative ABC transport system permease protein